MRAREIIKRNLFYSVLLGFISGLLVYHFKILPKSIDILLVLISFGLVLYSLRIKKIKTEVAASVFILAVFLVSLGFGISRYSFFENQTESNFIKKVDQKISIEGLVINFPEKRSGSQRLILETDQGKVLVYGSLYPTVKYGDRVSASGKLGKPEVFETGAGKIFDYPNYLKKDRIFFTLSFANLEILERGQGNLFKRKLFSLKSNLIFNIEKVLPSPESNLLSGILLGLPDSSGQFDDDFRKTGLSHITVLSGYNIAVIALASIFIFSFLSYRRRFIVSGVFVVLFTVMVSSGSATWRAAIMALVVVFGKIIFRRISVWRSLYIAGLCMIIWNPLVLFYDPGFQLSFLATMGIIGLASTLSKKLNFLPKRFGIRETVAVSLSAQALVIPLIVYKSGQFSTVSILANLLVLPAVAPAMFLGFIALMIGFLPSLIYLPFAYLANLPLLYILKVAEFLAGIPFSIVNISFGNSFIVTVTYVFLFSLIYRIHKKRAREKLEALLGGSSIYDGPYSQSLPLQSPS